MYGFYIAMYFAYTLRAVEIFSFINVVTSHTYKRQFRNLTDEIVGNNTLPPDEYSEEFQDDPGNNDPADYYSFVALIDIVFQDGSKRTCSGAIVHDNAVITAAHCFTLGYQKDVQVEITASFVVIGTRLMFESGYEQYLPIEKILTHPNYSGWTADLALVYTYAGMTSDKPGRIIPLAGERGQTPVDSNVTVISWGVCHETYDAQDESKKHSNLRMPDDDGSVEMKRKKRHRTTAVIVSEEVDFEMTDTSDENKSKHSNLRTNHAKKKSSKKSVYRKEDDTFVDSKPSKSTKHRFNVKARGQLVQKIESHAKTKPPKRIKTTTAAKTKRQNIENIYLSQDYDFDDRRKRFVGLGKGNKKTQHRAAGKKEAAMKSYNFNKNQDDNIVKKDTNWPGHVTLGWARRKRSHIHPNNNWRRHMMPHKNNLTVEMFNFVNSVACLKLIDKSMPAFFSIKNKNEILCYTSDEHYITFADSGAPALQQGNLVAVTVGGTEWEGEHVAVGMKMSCYCPWIADNLPNVGEIKIKCCTNCCDDSAKSLKRRNQKISYNKLRTGSVHRYKDGDDEEGEILSEPETPSLYRRAEDE